MLESLQICQLGVIQTAQLDFKPGLTVLTGETGAGKTMVLTSLQWLSGGRVNPTAVRVGAKQASVDAQFSDLSAQAVAVVEEAGGALEEGAVWATRLVPKEGRSKAILGGRPVPAATLTEFSESLVGIHGQSEQMTLRSSALQRQFLDEQAGREHQQLLESFQEKWDEWLQLAQRHREAAEQAHLLQLRFTQLSEQVRQVEALEVTPGEDEELRNSLEKLTNVEELRAGALLGYQALEGTTEVGAVALLGQASGELQRLMHLDSDLAAIYQDLESCENLAQEVKSALLTYLEGLDADPKRLEESHQRLAQIKAACRGKAVDASGLLEWLEGARKELQTLSTSLDLDELAGQVEVAHQQVAELGKRLTQSRKRAGADLAQRVNGELEHLALAGAKFRIEISEVKASRSGFDEIKFWLRPHPKAPEALVSNAVSGGELSRIMLALELARNQRQTYAPTLVFDEVDAGIGGNAALEVGKRLAKLAQQGQVIVVTHLAQVAAWANQHFVVTKQGDTAQVVSVEGEARITEIARMLSGKSSSNTARQHAAELLNACRMR